MQEICGAKINCTEKVYCPAEDTLLAINMLLKSMKGSRLKVAEIGTGTGAIGIVAAMDQKTESITLSDISEDALECAKENAELNKVLEKCSFYKSNLFENVRGSFDIIIFNPPYLPDDDEVKKGKAEWSGGTTGIETTKLFIEQAVKHLAEHGKIITVASSFADRNGLEYFIKAQGLEVEDSETAHIFFEDITALLLKRNR